MGEFPDRLVVRIVSANEQFVTVIRQTLQTMELPTLQFIDESAMENGSSCPIDLMFSDGNLDQARSIIAQHPRALMICSSECTDRDKSWSEAKGVVRIASPIAENSGSALADTIGYLIYRHLYRRAKSSPSPRTEEFLCLERMFGQSTPFDPRTGWHSHAHIIDRCQDEIARAAHDGLPIALVLVDILGLELIQETHGAERTSELVTELASRIRAISRHTDRAGHYGPSTLLVILTNTDHEGGQRFCDRVQQALLPPFQVDEYSFKLECSMVLVARDRGMPVTPTELLNTLERRAQENRLATAHLAK